MIKKDAVSCLSLTNVNKNAGNSIFFHDRKRIGTYGELLQKAKNAVRFLYNGSYGVVTDENDLYYMRARYYNPDIKRFLNQDIKVGDISNGQGLNRYAYCEGNPVSMVDPFGLSPQISQDQTSRFSVLHNILDLAGLAFDAADVINAAFYAAEGDWTNAALCAVAVIPIAGSAIAGAAKGTKAVVKAKKAEKILELAEESCKMTRNASDRLDVFSDVMKVSSKWGNSPVKLMDGIKAETGSRAIKALETGGDFGRESKRAVQELKAVAGAEGIHLKPSVSRKVDVFKDSFVTTEKKVKSGSSSGKYQVGAYQDIKGVEGLDAHHVGQKALMKKLVADYDELTAPAINVPKLGHTKRHPERGIVSRSTKGITNARQLLARDLFELKRVYPDIPNSALKELIDMNKKMYPEMRK